MYLLAIIIILVILMLFLNKKRHKKVRWKDDLGLKLNTYIKIV
jgi:hypothetical protein